MTNKSESDTELELLKFNIDSIKENVERVDKRESIAQKLLSGSLISFVLAFLIAIGGSQYFSLIREREVISRIDQELSEARSEIDVAIEELSGGIAPASVSIESFLNREDRYLTGEVYFYQNSTNVSTERYTLQINIPFRVRMTGVRPAKLLGVFSRYTEELPSLIFRDGRGPEQSYMISKLVAGHYVSFGSEGTLMSPFAPINNELSLQKNFLTCDDAAEMLRDLVSLSSIGQVHLRPVPEIEPTAEAIQEQSFFIRFASNQLYSCEDIGAAVPND